MSKQEFEWSFVALPPANGERAATRRVEMLIIHALLNASSLPFYLSREMGELSLLPVLDNGMEVSLEPLPYHLEDACPVPWSPAQKAGLLGSGGCGGYPL